MRQELGADGATECEIQSDSKKKYRYRERDFAMHDGCANRDAIVADEPAHDGVFPLFGPLAEEDDSHDGRNDDGEDQGADQGE